MELTVTVHPQHTDLNYIARYSGEQWTQVFAFTDRTEETALDVSGADLYLTLGSIEKSNSDFTKNVDNESNKASVLFKESDTDSSGVHRGQITIDKGNTITKTPPITLELLSGNASVTLEDMRGLLWDLATENDLWDEDEFSDAILALGRRRAIDLWNGQAGQHDEYDVDSFPNEKKYYFLQGSVGEALIAKSRNLLGNDLTYNAGGIQVDDKKTRSQVYAELGRAMKTEWVRFVRREQYNESMRRSFKSLTVR